MSRAGDRGINLDFPRLPRRARFVSCGAFYETNDLDDHATCHAFPPGTALSCFFITLRTARVSTRADVSAYVQRLIPFSAQPMVNEPGLSLSPTRRRSVLVCFLVRTLRYVSPSDLRAIYKYRCTPAYANQWGYDGLMLRRREDAWIYTTCLPLKSFGAGIRRVNNSQSLFSYGYDVRPRS